MNSSAVNNLLEIAKQTVDWNEQEQLLRAEDQFIEKKEFLMLKQNQLQDKKIRKYLMLGSLPFYIYDTDQDQRTILQELWPDEWLDLKNSEKREFNGRLPTLPRGNMLPTYMVIGDAPGKGKSPGIYDRTMTFGPSSHMLRKALIYANIYYDCWFTNLVKVSQPHNQPTELEDVLEWKQYLLKEIELLRPECLILLGDHVQYMFYSNYQIEAKKIVKIYHPSYIVRKNLSPQWYASDIKLQLEQLR